MIAMTTSNFLRLHINDHDFDSSLYDDRLSLRLALGALSVSTRNRLAPEVVQYG